MDSKLTLALQAVPDDELLRRLSDLVGQSRRVEADLIAHIAEVDERRLFARQAFPSMFAYCTEALHLSEADAYRRITVARAGRKHPELLEALRDGRVHLSGLALLVSVVTRENCALLLARAAHRTRRQIEDLLAEQSPRPDAPSIIRKLPQPRVATARSATASIAGELFPGRVVAGGTSLPSAASSSPTESGSTAAMEAQSSRPATLPEARPSFQALSPGRFRVQFTASAELRDKLERLTALLRHEIPDGDLSAVIDRAVTEKLDRLEARRFGRTEAPRTNVSATDVSATSRHVPAAVRRAVHERDGFRCRFADEQGRRCPERLRLEFHHRHPFAMGGDHSPNNVSLLCPQHNRLLAERDYGRAAMRRHTSRTTSPASGVRKRQLEL
jgi:hypothetical protein